MARIRGKLSAIAVFIFMLIIFLFAVPASVSSAEAAVGDTSRYGDYTFTQSVDGEWELTEYTGRGGKVSFPVSFRVGRNTVYRYRIADNALKDNRNITELELPVSVFSIGKNAFDGSENLRTVYIFGYQEYVGDGAFANCEALIAVNFEEGTQRLGTGVFENCASLKNAALFGIATIGDGTFKNCSSLTDIAIPEVKEIGDNAFENSAFSSVDLSLVENIGEGAFKNSANLERVILGEGLKSIGALAFYGCDLKEISIPSTVTEIGEGAFLNNRLKKLHFAVNSRGLTELKNIKSGVFHEDDGTNLYSGVVLPEGVETVEAGAFGSLKAISVPSTLAASSSLEAQTVNMPNLVINGPNAQKFADLIKNNDNPDRVFVFPSQDAYKAVYAKLENDIRIRYDDWVKKNDIWNATDKPSDEADAAEKNLDDARNAFYSINQIYYVLDFEFQFYLYDENAGQGTTPSFIKIENKLAQDTDYLSPQNSYNNKFRSTNSCFWTLCVDENGVKYWEFDENYRLPEEINDINLSDILALPDMGWKWDNEDVDLGNMTVSAERTHIFTLHYGYDGHPNSPKAEFVFPFNNEETVLYSGEKWAIPSEFKDIIYIDGYDEIDLTAVGNYEITVSFIGTVKSDPTTYGNSLFKFPDTENTFKTFTLEILPVKGEIIWNYNGKNLDENAVYTKIYDGEALNDGLTLTLKTENGKLFIVDKSYIRNYLAKDGMSVEQVIAFGAGVWNLEVDASVNENVEIIHLSQIFKIDSKPIDLNDKDNLLFGIPEDVLLDGQLFIYDINGKEEPFVIEQKELGSPKEIVDVLNSYARYRKDTVRNIGLFNIPVDVRRGGSIYSVISEDGTTADDTGVYTATVILQPSSNYTFSLAADTNAKMRGVEITLNFDGTAEVRKTWYIVKLENMLFDLTKSQNAQQGVPYSFPSEWTYGESPMAPIPRLQHGDERTAWQNSRDLVNITLTGDNGIEASFDRADWNTYVNAYMPSGNYKITFTVNDVEMDSHTHWWNGEHVHQGETGLVYRGFEIVYTFSVNPRAIDESLRSFLTDDAVGKTFNNEFDGLAHYMPSAYVNSILSLSAPVKPANTAFWAGNDDYFDTEFAFNYNIETMNNNLYYSPERLAELEREGGHNVVTPLNVGKYVIYFTLSAKNYIPIGNIEDDSERKDWVFYVIVYGKVDLPSVITDYVYNGREIVPFVRDDERYKIDLPLNCVNVDEYELHLTLRQPSDEYNLYIWNIEGETYSENPEEITQVYSYQINVTKADNYIIGGVSMNSWTYGGFDADINTPKCTPYHGEATLRFEKYDETNGYTEVYFDSASTWKAGAYRMFYSVAGDRNWNPINEDIQNVVYFHVSLAQNYWTVSPFIERWNEGEFNPDKNKFFATAAYGNATLKNVLYDEDGNELDFNALASLPCGYYKIVSSVDVTGDYTGLYNELSFKIFETRLPVVSVENEFKDSDDNPVSVSVSGIIPSDSNVDMSVVLNREEITRTDRLFSR